MSHTSRRGPPVECPLASLGRNTPARETQTYHHPLSSSPLQVYQMSRESPILNSNNIIYSSRSSEHNSIPISDSKNYHLSRSSSSSLDQPYTLRRDLDEDVYRPPPRNYTPSVQMESILSYHDRLSPDTIDRTRSAYLHTDLRDDNSTTETSSVVVVNHNNRYYLEEKMDSLYIQGAIRNMPGIGNNKSTNSIDSERYYLEENMDNMCHYPPPNRLESDSPNLMRRASSPSETSSSDRYLINGSRSSSALINKLRTAKLQSQDRLYSQSNLDKR